MGNWYTCVHMQQLVGDGVGPDPMIKGPHQPTFTKLRRTDTTALISRQCTSTHCQVEHRLALADGLLPGNDGRERAQPEVGSWPIGPSVAEYVAV